MVSDKFTLVFLLSRTSLQSHSVSILTTGWYVREEKQVGWDVLLWSSLLLLKGRDSNTPYISGAWQSQV